MNPSISKPPTSMPTYTANTSHLAHSDGAGVGVGPPLLLAYTSTVQSYAATATTNLTISEDEEDERNLLLLIPAATIMVSIIVAAIFGNLLVIISVMRVRKLR
jgi:hypothetical protein